MNNKKEYLLSLLKWSEEVEKEVKAVNTANSEELNQWLEQFADWKKNIEMELEQSESVEKDSVLNYQDESEALVRTLKGLFNATRDSQSFIQPGNHQLPPLPYAYDALEPYISEEIMRLHHDKHHQSYVDGLNKAEKELYLNKPDKNLIKHWMREQAFHGSGHYLHTIFWMNMHPKGGGNPKNNLLARIKQDFGSVKNFKQLFTKAAESVEGVGWAILVWEPRAGRLGIQTVEKHQMSSLWDSVPLLVVDVWEHAYYLQYNNNRSKYMENWWNVVNWSHVEKRYDEAQSVIWKLY